MVGARLTCHTAAMTIRNAVIIIILCLILSIVAADPFHNGAPGGLNRSARAGLKDAFAAGLPRSAVPRPALTGGRSEDLHDAVAGSPVPDAVAELEAVLDFTAGAPSAANAPGAAGGPPRGSGDGGFPPLPNNPRPIISPSGPTPPSLD